MATTSMLTSPRSHLPSPTHHSLPGARATHGADFQPRRRSVAHELVRVAVVEPHDVVVAGWTQLLESASSGRYVVADPDCPEIPDVTLYGVYSSDSASPHDSGLHDLLRSTGSTVIATHWEDTPTVVEAALSCGVHGALSQRLPQARLLEGIESIHRKRDRAQCPPSGDYCHPEITHTGLTPRELDVLRLIAAGLSNQEIAGRLYLSLNTVKTYIRTGYRKIGAERRPQAVIWASQHGLIAPVPASA